MQAGSGGKESGMQTPWGSPGRDNSYSDYVGAGTNKEKTERYLGVKLTELGDEYDKVGEDQEGVKDESQVSGLHNGAGAASFTDWVYTREGKIMPLFPYLLSSLSRKTFSPLQTHSLNFR